MIFLAGVLAIAYKSAIYTCEDEKWQTRLLSDAQFNFLRGGGNGDLLGHSRSLCFLNRQLHLLHLGLGLRRCLLLLGRLRNFSSLGLSLLRLSRQPPLLLEKMVFQWGEISQYESEPTSGV